jgi:hypothetical protein
VFERVQLQKLRRKADRLARRTEAYGKQYDADEIASAALPVLYARYHAGASQFQRRFPGKEMTFKKTRHSRRCAQAVRVSAFGGHIGTGVPLEADLAGRKLGYRTLKPWNAESYAAHYRLPPNNRKIDGITAADLKAARSPLAKLQVDWTWIEARDSGASHADAARACGKGGSNKACESFSLRKAESMRRMAVAAGLNADYDNGRMRTTARPLPTAMPSDEDSWRNAVISGRINCKRGI